MSRHISEQFDAELETVRSLLMEMGGLVEQQLQRSCHALVSHDVSLAEKAREDERKVNALEIEIDDACVHVLARRQPAASDLRTLISIMKASTDLERIGDESERIAKMAMDISHLEIPVNQYSDVRALQQQVVEMLRNSLNAFARLDAKQAVDVINADEAVDAAYNDFVRNQISSIREQAAVAERAVGMIWVARALERIGDHAKNIGEQTVYLVKGEDVRHTKSVPER